MNPFQVFINPFACRARKAPAAQRSETTSITSVSETQNCCDLNPSGTFVAAVLKACCAALQSHGCRMAWHGGVGLPYRDLRISLCPASMSRSARGEGVGQRRAYRMHASGVFERAAHVGAHGGQVTPALRAGREVVRGGSMKAS